MKKTIDTATQKCCTQTRHSSNFVKNENSIFCTQQLFLKASAEIHIRDRQCQHIVTNMRKAHKPQILHSETYWKCFPNSFICHALLITRHESPAHPAHPSHKAPLVILFSISNDVAHKLGIIKYVNPSPQQMPERQRTDKCRSFLTMAKNSIRKFVFKPVLNPKISQKLEMYLKLSKRTMASKASNGRKTIFKLTAGAPPAVHPKNTANNVNVESSLHFHVKNGIMNPSFNKIGAKY